MADKVGFIGAGNMAGAIVKSLLQKKVASPADLAVYDHHSAHYAAFETLGVRGAADLRALLAFADVIVLSVKPQNYADVLEELRGHMQGKIVVSIAAGISSAFIRQRLGEDAKVVLAMPNTPLLLGEGATALCPCPPISDADYKRVRRIFEAGGAVQDLPEEQMAAVISVSGSSPAYIYLFAKAVIDDAVRQGIDAGVAKALICQTLIGSARMLMESGKTPDELIQMVSSKGGTTIAALEAMRAGGFEQAVADGMEQCTRRARELGR